MDTFLKANCLGAYALALLSLAVTLPWDLGPVMQNIALVLLAIHVFEAIVAFKHIKTYQGPLWLSLLLALLFGLLHWLPLARAAKATGRG
jgi:uncharacterized protein YhhL (DUF1145 family)